MWAGRVFFQHDSRRITYCSSVSRNRLDNDGVGTDACIFTYRESTQNLGSCTDDHAALKSRVAFLTFIQACAAQGDALVNRTIVSDNSRFANDDAEAMVDEHPASQLRTGVDLDSCQHACQ